MNQALRYRAKVDIASEVELSPLLSLGKSVQIGPRAKIKASEGRIVIGADMVVGAGAVIGGHVHGVIIGENCVIGAGATIMGVNYRYDRLDVPIREQGLILKGPILIGDNVWIGEGAVILDATQIESGARVAPCRRFRQGARRATRYFQLVGNRDRPSSFNVVFRPIRSRGYSNFERVGERNSDAFILLSHPLFPLSILSI